MSDSKSNLNNQSQPASEDIQSRLPRLTNLKEKILDKKEQLKEIYHELKNDPEVKEAVKNTYDAAKDIVKNDPDVQALKNKVQEKKELVKEKFNETVDTEKLKGLAQTINERKGEVLVDVYNKAWEVDSFKNNFTNATIGGALLGFGLGCVSAFRKKSSFLKIPFYSIATGGATGGAYFYFNRPSMKLDSLSKDREPKN